MNLGFLLKFGIHCSQAASQRKPHQTKKQHLEPKKLKTPKTENPLQDEQAVGPDDPIAPETAAVAPMAQHAETQHAEAPEKQVTPISSQPKNSAS